VAFGVSIAALFFKLIIIIIISTVSYSTYCTVLFVCRPDSILSMALVGALASGFQESGLADDVKARLRSFVAQQLLRSTENLTTGSEAPADGKASRTNAIEDGIVFEYLRRSKCTYTLPVFVAERPWSRESDTLAAMGALATRIQRPSLAVQSKPKNDGPSSSSSATVLQLLVDAADRMLSSGSDDETQHRASERAVQPSVTLAAKLAESDTKHSGAAEIAALRASFAAQMHDYQRAVDLRAEGEVQARKGIQR
jgi:hypothetical protein